MSWLCPDACRATQTTGQPDGSFEKVYRRIAKKAKVEHEERKRVWKGKLPPPDPKSVEAIKQFKEVVAQAFHGAGAASIKFDCERRAADPGEMVPQVPIMLGRDRPILVQPYEEACGRRWSIPPSHVIYAVGSAGRAHAGRGDHGCC